MTETTRRWPGPAENGPDSSREDSLAARRLGSGVGSARGPKRRIMPFIYRSGRATSEEGSGGEEPASWRRGGGTIPIQMGLTLRVVEVSRAVSLWWSISHDHHLGTTRPHDFFERGVTKLTVVKNRSMPLISTGALEVNWSKHGGIPSLLVTPCDPLRCTAAP